MLFSKGSRMSDENSQLVNSPIVEKVPLDSVKLEPNGNIPMLLRMIQDNENAIAILKAQLHKKNDQFKNHFEKLDVKTNVFNKFLHITSANEREITILKERISQLQKENHILKSDNKRACLWFLNKPN